MDMWGINKPRRDNPYPSPTVAGRAAVLPCDVGWGSNSLMNGARIVIREPRFLATRRHPGIGGGARGAGGTAGILKCSGTAGIT
jgi:hypothetical protein